MLTFTNTPNAKAPPATQTSGALNSLARTAKGSISDAYYLHPFVR